MIYFAEKPSRAFHLLVRDALVHEIGGFGFDGRVYPSQRPRFPGCRRLVKDDLDWCALSSDRDKRLFTATTYFNELEKLLVAHTDKINLWHVSDYHWLILDRVLRDFIDYVSNQMRDKLIICKRMYLNKDLTGFSDSLCDFGYIADRYFHDGDYDPIGGLTPEIAESMSMNPETYGLQIGVKFNPRNKNHAMRVMKPVVKNMSWSWKED